MKKKASPSLTPPDKARFEEFILKLKALSAKVKAHEKEIAAIKEDVARVRSTNHRLVSLQTTSNLQGELTNKMVAELYRVTVGHPFEAALPTPPPPESPLPPLPPETA